MATLVERIRSNGKVKTAIGVVREMVREWSDDRVSDLAASVAFFAILSVFPGLLAVTAAIGSLEAIVGAKAAEKSRTTAIDFMRQVLTDEAEPLIAAVRDLFVSPNTGLLTFAMLGGLWAMSRGFAAVLRALNVAYDIEERRGYVRTRAIGLGLALGSVVVLALVLTMIVVGPLFGQGQTVAEAIGLGDVFAFLWDNARAPFVFAVLVLWAASIFHLAPNHRSPWRWDLPGALLAAILWLAIFFGFRLYLSIAAEANRVIGVLGGALILLILLYLLSVALLVGGELNAVLSRRMGVRTGGVSEG